MKPIKLTMQAFGSYGQKTTIDFRKPNQNLFLITGDTGAGKSTIFDAIVFALYGVASSENNKKEGTLLQSQYHAYDVEPYVELEFADGDVTDDIYTVRRVPRHERIKQRGTDKGNATREINGTVSLILPDGSEYPSKETNKKIEEIVGLTKEQFMQVAMIAQGEFMKLLRESSDKKKEIFRKLFNTEIFEQIVKELEERRRQKGKEIAIIKTECKTEVSRVQIPEEYSQRETLAQLQIQIKDEYLGNMEEFLEELCRLCEILEREKTETEQQCQQAGRLRDEARDAQTKAEALLKYFEQLEKAETDLQKYQQDAAAMQEAERLTEHLQAAYDIQAEWKRMSDAEKNLRQLQENLEKTQQALPELTQRAEQTASEEQAAKAEFDAVQETYTKTAERVKGALAILENIVKAKKEVQEKEQACKAAEESEQTAQEELTELEQKETAWKQQEQELKDVEVRRADWKGKDQRGQMLASEVKELETEKQNMVRYKKAADKAQQEYAKVKQTYHEKNQQLEEMRDAFLDAQAGLWAQRLEPGQPCPICGATEHPHPYQAGSVAEHVSEEHIKALEDAVQRLLEEREQKSGDVSSNTALYEGAKQSLQECWEKLAAHMKAEGLETVQEQAGEIIAAWQMQIRKEEEVLRQDEKTLAQIQKNLQAVEEQKKELHVRMDAYREQVKTATAKAEAARATLQSLEGTCEYPSKAAAEGVLTSAKHLRDEKQKIYTQKQVAAKSAKETRDATAILMERYTAEIPSRQTECSARKADYESIMAEKQLTEDTWMELTGQHAKSEVKTLRAAVEDYQKKVHAAQTTISLAKKETDGKLRPDLVQIRQEGDAAQKHLEEVQTRLQQVRDTWKANRGVYDKLAPKMKERKQVIAEQTRLDTLYRIASGNHTGARMDLETYVQRYYLEKILYAANRRFEEMSAGQFELRMVDAEQAGKGKNRGLDLMVYSNVTGKEREVRTLSGGESFMAALALALGMADQIQEGSSVIHLDIMFIDEGFGSLDEHSRNQAVKVLKEMAEGSKLIGIISHVTELKQEIDNQLWVQKENDGSHAEWRIS